jgi:hypothetical protein
MRQTCSHFDLRGGIPTAIRNHDWEELGVHIDVRLVQLSDKGVPVARVRGLHYNHSAFDYQTLIVRKQRQEGSVNPKD